MPLPLLPLSPSPTTPRRFHFWPLPPLTRAVCLLTLLVSTLSHFHLLSTLRCAAPSYTIDRLDFLSLLLSPFNVKTDPPLYLLLALLNILLFASFELWFRKTWRAAPTVHLLLAALFLSLSILRVFLGHLFTRLTGWTFPSLFFHEALHECSQGLSPILFALLMLRSSLPDGEIGYLKRGLAEKRKGLHKGYLCLLNCVFQTVLWWSSTGLLTGWIGALIMQTQQSAGAKSRRIGQRLFGEGLVVPSLRDASLTFKRGLPAFVFSLMVLLVSNHHYTQRELATPEMANSVSTDPYLITFVIMTAPRKGNPPLLIDTIESYLKNLPEPKPLTGLYSRIQFVVYTHFTDHAVFDMARSVYSGDLKASQYIRWVREEGTTQNQRLHISKSLRNVTETYQSTYTAVLEDDFPVCEGRWQDLLDTVYRANLELPSHCGLFVATGGSGLIFKQKYAELASRVLLEPAVKDVPPDVVLQDCLLGELSSCSECKDNLVISRTLLMYHIGHNVSTSNTRSYAKSAYQCGWRHPFNGNTHVLTL